MKMKFEAKSCADCGEQMEGIHSYTIRTHCTECGGKSLVSPDVQKDLARAETKHLAKVS